MLTINIDVRRTPTQFHVEIEVDAVKQYIIPRPRMRRYSLTIPELIDVSGLGIIMYSVNDVKDALLRKNVITFLNPPQSFVMTLSSSKLSAQSAQYSTHGNDIVLYSPDGGIVYVDFNIPYFALRINNIISRALSSYVGLFKSDEDMRYLAGLFLSRNYYVFSFLCQNSFLRMDNPLQ